MTTTAISPSSRKKDTSINFSFTTAHTYLADDSEYQSVIREITEEYIEHRQDKELREEIKNSKKMKDLDTLFLAKVGSHA